MDIKILVDYILKVFNQISSAIMIDSRSYNKFLVSSVIVIGSDVSIDKNIAIKIDS